MNNRPRIIEFVGLAGTGKSSLLNALRQQNQEIRDFLPPPKIGLLLFLIQKAHLWIPLFIRSYRCVRRFDLVDAWAMYYLDHWLYHLRAQALIGVRTIVLDPGSVFWLTRLDVFVLQNTGPSAFKDWWEDKLGQWSLVLDTIIWLDAPEELCLERVLGRNQWHPAKHEKKQEVLTRFRNLRSGYGQILSKMSLQHPKKILFFRTDQQSIEQMVKHILAEVDLTPSRATSTE